nr:hypothetical protein OH837_02730 [Streptomyces canus]
MLSVHRRLELPDGVPSRTEEWMYLPAWQRESRPDQSAALTGGRPQARQLRRVFEHRRRLVNELHGAGVRLAAGTDTGRDTSSRASPSTTAGARGGRPHPG